MQNILKEFFYALTGALVIFCLLEIIWPGAVLAYLNINWILLIWLIIAIFILSFENKEKI